MISSLSIEFEALETTYDSWKALTSAPETERDQRATRDSLLLQGTHVIDAWASMNSVCFLLDDGRCVSVFVGCGIVEWAVSERCDGRPDTPTYADRVALTLSGFGELAWHPHALLADRAGHAVLEVSASETTVTVHVHGCPSLFFSPAVESRGGEPVIYFEDAASFTDPCEAHSAHVR